MAKASQVVLSENEFYLIKAPNGKVLEVKNFNTENGAAIRLWDYAGHPWQQWKFVDAGEGRWRIQNRFTGKMMDLALGGVVEGTWLHQWGRTSGLSQCWALEPTRNGRTRIRNVLADKYMNPITDGAVLPILHLNGFKIANPTIFSRMSHEEVECFFRGCGWEPRFVEGDEPETMHQQMAAAVDWAIREIKRIQRTARESGKASRPRWPMLVLRTPKGWTGPKEVDGNAIEGSWRAHQVPISMGADESKHLPLLEQWLRSYKPEELFNEDGTPVELIASFPPKGERRMGANPHANGGLLLRDLRTPDFRDYAVDIPAPGEVEAQDMYVLGTYVRDVMKLNMESRNFRIFAPDETVYALSV